MKHSTPLVFFGSDNFSRVVLSDLLESGYPIVLVVSNPEQAVSGRRPARRPVAELAKERELAMAQPAKFDGSAVKTLKDCGAEYAVLASYGQLLPQAVLGLFKSIINVHPSLLPRWRGPSPIEAAILAGDAETGASLMKLVAAMDAGPVYAQSRHRLSGRETQAELRQALAEDGSQLLLEYLPDILSGKLEPRPQNENSATYCKLIGKTAGQLDWNRPAVELERQIRAYRQWPQSQARLFDRDIIVVQASVESGSLQPGQTSINDGRLRVGTSLGKLRIDRLKPAGRSEMDAGDFLRGLRS